MDPPAPHASPTRTTYFTDPAAIKHAARKVYAAKAPYIYIDEDDFDGSHYNANGVDFNCLDLVGSGLMLRVHRNQSWERDERDERDGPEDEEGEGEGEGSPLPAQPQGVLRLLTPEQVTRETKRMCRPCDYYWCSVQGLELRFDCFGFSDCSFCHQSMAGFDVTVCKTCHKLACALCTVEMETGVATEGSLRFEFRKEALKTCASHGGGLPRPRKQTLGMLANNRCCDVCNELLVWGRQWWMTQTPDALTGDSHDLCKTCVDTSRGQELRQRHPGMVMRTSTPMAINEFAGLGVLADWVLVAEYVPKVTDEDEDGNDDTDEFQQLLVFVRDDNDAKSEDLDSDLQTLLIILDNEDRRGMMGLPLQITAVLDIIAAGQISKVLATYGFGTFFG